MRNLNLVLIALVMALPSYGQSKESLSDCSRDSFKDCSKLALISAEKKPDGSRELIEAKKYSEIGCDAGDALSCIILSAIYGEQGNYDEAKKLATLGCLIGKTEKICSWLNDVDDFTNKDREKQGVK